jgi:hypothetical protein
MVKPWIRIRTCAGIPILNEFLRFLYYGRTLFIQKKRLEKLLIKKLPLLRVLAVTLKLAFFCLAACYRKNIQYVEK